MDENKIKELINECIQELVGDTPVSYQLDAALRHKADAHEQQTLQEDLDALKKEIERIANLVGDTSVAEQISAALK